MKDITQIDFTILDRPDILSFLFHPRPELNVSDIGPPHHDMLIPVEEDVAIGARFHLVDNIAPNILFFHGNGEIVADYDDLGPVYNQLGINFLAVDYRGYGRSTGKPTITAMMRDCHIIFEFIRKWLAENEYKGPLIVMGRSLGSASALELAVNYQSLVGGLIIESGLAYVRPLLKLLGIDSELPDFQEEKGFQNVDKIRSFKGPTLIIHAENDHIIPFKVGQILYEACGSAEKTLLTIPHANHNDIFLRGFNEYMQAVKLLTAKAKQNII
ncbi:alpha/beta hydrolase [Thermodesulfobacteriota bacterium]